MSKKSFNIFKAGVLVIGFLLCSVLTNAQIPDASIQFAQPVKINGYFFITPYLLNASSAREALLHKVMILNAKGEVVYFRKSTIGNDFKLHPNGAISFWNGSKWLLADRHLNVTDSVACVNGIQTDNHDFLILQNGHYLLIGKQSEKQDLSQKNYFYQPRAVAGSKNATVKYDVIQELDEHKKLVFQWSSKDHFKLEDADRLYLTDTASVDVTHFNSIDEDTQGNLLVSARYFNEVLKINKKTGKIIWRLGGKYNNVKVLNNNQAFLGQHDARFTGPNTFSLFDNGHHYDFLKQNARALVYHINDSSKTAKVISEYSNPGKLYSQAAGNVQRMKNGYSLINYGRTSAGGQNITLEILDKYNEKILTLFYADTMASYRAYYYENIPVKIKQPKLKLIRKNGVDYITTVKPYNHYLWNNGKTEKEIEFVKDHTYYTFVSKDGAVYIRSRTK